jgi:hypothetical protein
MLRQQLGCQLRHRDVALGINPADQNINMRRQRTTPKGATLTRWHDRSRSRLALRQPNRRSRAHSKAARSTTARTAALNLTNNPNP